MESLYLGVIINVDDKQKPISIQNDPWEAYNDIIDHGKLTLSNIEFTTTNLCNMRCSHCAVGYTLQTKDPDPLPMDVIYRRLDEIPNLRTMSITGGEPMFSKKSIKMWLNLYLNMHLIVEFMFK